jgi:hypothetical protein
MLAVAAIAMATTTATYSQSYSTAKKNVSAGTKFATSSSEDQNASNNHQPKSTREFDVTFPAGSKIDYTAAPVCKHLDESKADPCPKNTKVGDGHAQVLLPFPGTAPITATVTAYNRVKGLFLYVVPSVGAPVVLKPVYKGLKLKTATPPNCLAGTNQNGQCVNNDGSKGQEAVLTEFDLTTKAIRKGKKNYLTTPKACPKGGWKFSAHITYSDGTSTTLGSSSKCK